MSLADMPVNDYDQHYYEAIDAFTRHLDPKLGQRIIQWCDIGGRKYHVIGGKVSHAVVNPTFDPVSPAGAMAEYFRGNPSGKSPLEFLKEREPIRPAYRDRDARLRGMDEQGIEKIWLFPTLGMIYEELLKDDPQGVGLMFQAFNRWLEEDWGYGYQDRIYAAPYIALADIDMAVAELERALSLGATTVVMRPAAPNTVNGRRTPAHEDFDPFWARVNEAGITVVAHAGDSGYGLNGYGNEGFSASFGEGARKPTIGFVTIERAIYDFLASLMFDKLFDRFPNVRVRVGGERRRVPRRPVQEAPLRLAQDPGLLVRGPGRDVQAQRVDQPVLGGRRLRGRRAHGRRPGGVRLRLAAHRGPALAARLPRGGQGARRGRPASRDARQRDRAQHAAAHLAEAGHQGRKPSNIRRIAKLACAPAMGVVGESRITAAPAAIASIVASRSTRPAASASSTRA